MPDEPNQSAPEPIDPEKLSTPAGLVSDLEEEAVETGATTDADDASTER